MKTHTVKFNILNNNYCMKMNYTVSFKDNKKQQDKNEENNTYSWSIFEDDGICMDYLEGNIKL